MTLHEKNTKILKEWSDVKKVIRSNSDGKIVLELYNTDNEVIGRANIPKDTSFLISASDGNFVFDFDVTRTIEFKDVASCKLKESKDVILLECDGYGKHSSA